MCYDILHLCKGYAQEVATVNGGLAPVSAKSKNPWQGGTLNLKWPWVKIQIVPPVNIRFNPTTKTGSKLGGGVDSPTNQNGIPKRS